MFEAIKTLFAGIKPLKKQLFSVPFSYRKPQQKSLFGTYAYLFAINKQDAIRATRSHIQSQGYEFIELIDDIRIIPVAEWTHHVNKEWPMFKDILPSMGELKMAAEKNRIYVLPSIEQKS